MKLDYLNRRLFFFINKSGGMDWTAVGEVGGRCKSYYFLLTLVMENRDPGMS